MRLETAREVILARRSIQAEALREDTGAKKSATAEKSEDNKKRKSGDRP